MTTDEDRAFADDLAQRIYNFNMDLDPRSVENHFAQDFSYVESMRRGLLGECAFSDMFGMAVDCELRAGGDGGRDFFLNLETQQGRQRFKVDVKTKSVRFSWEGLRRSGTHLRVPVKQCRPLTIYVFAIYREPTDDAEVLRWAFGQTMMKDGEVRTFERGNEEPCFAYDYERCRELGELMERRADAA